MQNHVRLHFHSWIQNSPWWWLCFHSLESVRSVYTCFQVLTFIWRCWNDISDCSLNSLERDGENFEDGTRQGVIAPCSRFFFPFILHSWKLIALTPGNKWVSPYIQASKSDNSSWIIYALFSSDFFIIIVPALGSISNLEGALLFCEGCVVGSWVL